MLLKTTLYCCYKTLLKQADTKLFSLCQEAKACLLLESPGFSITSDYYDEDSYQKKYTSDHSRPSPDYLTAQLCDKVPALSDYYYDTGDHISFKWRQLLQTYWLTYRPADDRNLKERYEKAIEMLYVNYAKQEKTQLYKEVSIKSIGFFRVDVLFGFLRCS